MCNECKMDYEKNVKLMNYLRQSGEYEILVTLKPYVNCESVIEIINENGEYENVGIYHEDGTIEIYPEYSDEILLKED